jgi:hypothetical protein
MMSGTSRPLFYRPGWLAKASVIAAGALYFVGLYFDAMRGADLNQAAFLHLLVPVVFVIPVVIVAQVAYWIGRRSRRVGDIAFTVAIVALCVALTVSANAR